jgi:hypothetical protein
MGAVYPVKWNSFTVAPDAKMDWSYTKDKPRPRSTAARPPKLVLNRGDYGNVSRAAVVINNLKYWGVPRNDGFVLMKNDVEAYRAATRHSSSRAPTAL